VTADTKAVAEYWDRAGGTDVHLHRDGCWWNAGPEIYAYRNSKISGDPAINWIRHTLETYFAGQLPLRRCLSLGCGQGRLERQLAELGAFQQCDAYDISPRSVQRARELAQQKGFDHIAYEVADANTLILPQGHYDAVWISMAMHHFEALEHVCEQIKKALTPGGLLILEEYVGPNRFQFPERQKEVANLCLSLLPSRYRVKPKKVVHRETSLSTQNGMQWVVARFIDKLKDGTLLDVLQRRVAGYRARRSGKMLEKRQVNFPSSRDVIAADPSESIRSEEIVDVLQQYFEIVEKKDWGGNILQFLLSDIAGNFSGDDRQARVFLQMLVDIEDAFLQSGEFASDFSYIVARPLR
jgi:SAM-dependent methyltransferase